MRAPPHREVEHEGHGEAQALAEKRLADVRGKLAELQRIEAALAELVDRCGAADGRVNCPLIESLQDAG